MTWQTFVFLAVAGAAFGYSGYRFSLLFRMAKAQTGKAPVRWDHLPVRFGQAFLDILLQRAVARKKIIGILHATIFWGFILITLGTLEQFATTLHELANFEFIGPDLYSGFIRLQDFLPLFVLIAVLGAAVRRLIVRPPHLGQSRDANLVLLFTGGLMVSILLMNAFHILGHAPWYQESMPVAQVLAGWISTIPMSLNTAAGLATLFKWIHMLLVLGFAVYIPGSKHLHIVAAGPNSFLKQLTREKGMRPIPFEDESVTQYGAAKISQMSWKDVLDYASCTECGRCQEVCPAHNTDKPLSPKKLILDLKHNLYDNKAALLTGNSDAVTHVIDQNVTEDVIWACTSCRACEIACPVYIEHTDKIFEIRRNLVLMESRFPAEVQAVFKNMETNATPWAFSASDRSKWADGLSIPTLTESVNASQYDVVLWVGCAGSYDDRNQKVLRSFVNVLKKASVKFAILGNEEQCTGDPARRIGNEYLFQTLAQANVEKLNRYAVQKVVTACPHCFNTLKNEYKDFGGKYEVMHHSQYIAELIRGGKIKPTQALDETVTFHDSCYLGRWNGIYSEPRATLSAIPSTRLVEMKNNHEQSMCCGAGGGRMWMEEHIGKRVNIARTEQALDTKAGVIASSCPFCMTMMTDGVKSKEMVGKVKVMDIAELVDQSTR